MFFPTNNGIYIDPAKALTARFDLPPVRGAYFRFLDGENYSIDGSLLTPGQFEQLKRVTSSWVEISPNFRFNVHLFSEIQPDQNDQGATVLACFIGPDNAHTVTDPLIISKIVASFPRYTR